MFSTKLQNGFLSALPYLAMWLFSMAISHVADWMLIKGGFSHTVVRKLINGIGKIFNVHRTSKFRNNIFFSLQDSMVPPSLWWQLRLQAVIAGWLWL